ncbi:DUF805 domain-containing protein [Chitinophaga oryziterrae]|uniref:DUF805 domain-containing protein n=1 Tax=Chitinophaga oryziterrae TaxID=1031224 RepID=A0A6N8J2Z5_9BACT|nr:DUF805 domain-containing protein [Chitinophaga oryziterrae]MVT39068.1 DUF805 domain-containing protein [Chitinophaga oryziterrae]
MFKKLFSFKGRIRRTEYGISLIIYLIFLVLVQILPESGSDSDVILAMIYALLLIPMIWMLYAQGAKRCHDVGKSGWWQIIPFYVLLLLFKGGDEGPNEYGPNPKSDSAEDIIDSIGKE